MKACYTCGSVEHVHKHHIHWHHDNNATENITFLCQRCHNELHKVGYLTHEELGRIRAVAMKRDPERFAQANIDKYGQADIFPFDS